MRYVKFDRARESSASPLKSFFRLVVTVLSMAAAYAVYHVLSLAVRSSLPPFIILYPAVMLISLLIGSVPGILATVIAVLITVVRVLPAKGHLELLTAADILALALFAAMGVFISVIAALLRRAQSAGAHLQKDMAVHESENRFSTIFHASPIGMAITSMADGHYIDVNEKFLDIMGYSREEVVGKTATQLKAWAMPEDRSAFIAQLGKQHRVPDKEAQFRRKSGEVFVARLSAEMIVLVGESVILSLLQDITEEKRAEEALASLAAIVETAEEAIIGETPAGIITSWNEGAERLYGYSAGEVIGRSISVIIPSDQQGEFAAIHERISQGRRIEPYDTVRIRKDGTRVDVSTAGSSILGPSGKVTAAATIERDITSRKRAEEEVRKLTADLELRVEKRTAELRTANIQLEEARKVAEEANMAKSSFLANMSHEIRTPMNAVIGFTTLALKTDLSTQQKDYLTKIHSAGVSLLGLINDILDFSKIEAGRLTIEDVDFSLDSIIEQLGSITGHNAFSKGLEFLVAVPTEIPAHLIGDANRLGQILTNLVGNAVKFTDHGEIELKVTLLETAGEKVKLQFSVRDTGLGMTEGQLSKLFQPFSQADSSITRRFGGTGLGLSITRRLVELMGGQIWVQSQAGAGATFTFTAWFGRGKEWQGRPSVVTRQIDGMRVLVVDDNATARDLLKEVLVSLHFSVMASASGEEAIEAVRSADGDDPFRLVLMDYKMPGIDGIEATRRILAPQSLQAPPVIIILSAFAGMEEGRSLAIAAGAREFLTKPATPSSILDAIMRIFSPNPGAESMSMKGEISASRRAQGVRILLVEDNEINQQIAGELLRSEGAEVAISSNGSEALQELSQRSSRYDLVLMDVQMPEMDGYEATRRIRAEAWGKDIPIIAMTAHALNEERLKALEAGMNDHITKPIDPDAMFQTIRKHYRGVIPDADEQPAQGLGRREAPLSAIAGIDMEAGLRRVAGNQALYVDLLRRFAEEKSATPAQIGEALARGSMETAEQLAHAVKGLSGNLGAQEVQASAGELEHRIHEREAAASLEASLLRLSASVEATTALIRASLPAAEDRGARASIPVSSDELEGIISGLLARIEGNDGDAMDYFESVLEKLSSVFSNADVEGLRRNLQMYNFSDALKTLHLLEKQR